MPETAPTDLPADLLAAVLAGVADGITVQVGDRLVYANDAAACLIGYPDAAALRAAPIAEILAGFEIFDAAGAPVSPAARPGRQVADGAPAAEAILRYRVRATGAEAWSRVRVRPLRAADG